MARPITVEVKIPGQTFNYDESDAEATGQAATQALVEYVNAGGELDAWTMTAEVYVFEDEDGVRLRLEGQEAE
jgi:hypothetical protein